MYVAWLKDLRMSDLPRVGGKNASLGEMIGGLARAGIRVPGGYATTAQAYQAFLSAAGLERRIAERIKGLDLGDVDALVRCGAEIRSGIGDAPFPADVEKDIRSYYQSLIKESSTETSFAVRSSATAEDLPDASFAGQQETFLNILGADQVLAAIRCVFASLYNDRAISYRAHHGFAHGAVAISAAVQRMVRSDRGASGVMFTLDTESGFNDVVFITSSWGLGEMVVQGAVKAMLKMAIRACRKQGKYVGICGQGPSDHPDFARWLMEQGIGSLSLNPDTVVSTWLSLSADAKGGSSPAATPSRAPTPAYRA